ncbi:hypothetical protein HBI23_199180 [Parastagonospora nodorum]|nr:hypothetical protein HBI47_127790 [Parastagonospora nodorum]KAH5641437.1 hypothetical protein HBI23_199180 [Parastagonospora nodorum]
MSFHNGLNGLTGLKGGIHAAKGFNSNGNYHSSPVTPTRTNSAVVESDSELAALYQKFEHYQQFDADKNKFMTDLFTRLEYAIQKNQSLEADRKRDTEFVGSWKAEKVQYEKYFKTLNRAMADNPFVMVLVDGDGMIFEDQYLQQGEAGGRRAASQLYAAVQEYVETEVSDVPLGIRIVCRMYANVRGLGDVLVRKGIIEHIGLFEDFVRGFTRGKTLFDFVDVGTGKDRADEKIIESFKMFSQDYHCRRLLFGCSHDNGYARSLEECSDRPDVVSKTVLLEGVPFEKELVPLPYSTKKFKNLFRESKIVLPGAYNYSQPTAAHGSPPSIHQTYNMLSGLPTRFPAPTRTPCLMDSPIPNTAALANAGMPRTPSSSTLASDGGAAVKQTNTWASMAAAPAPPKTEESPVYKPMFREEAIVRNRGGQRIDPSTKNYDKVEVDRVKKMKLCNVHFLRNSCPFGDTCSHEHSPKPNSTELETLRLVARMAPCMSGSGCQDIKCIYGHRCPAPPSRTHHSKGTKSCIFGEACKFPPELHDIDMTVVKTLVVR